MGCGGGFGVGGASRGALAGIAAGGGDTMAGGGVGGSRICKGATGVATGFSIAAAGAGIDGVLAGAGVDGTTRGAESAGVP
jgi:hypothetical protein